MPVRPSFGDPKYNGLSSEERMRQHERDLLLWEQQEAQKESNEIARQQLEEERQYRIEQMEQERENAERIAAATIQAEQDRFNNELQLEMLRQANENEQRKIRLCDDLGVDYEEIKIFDNYLKTGNEESTNKINELIELIQIQSNVLSEYKLNKPSEEKCKETVEKQIQEIQYKIKQNNYDDGTKVLKFSINVLLFTVVILFGVMFLTMGLGIISVCLLLAVGVFNFIWDLVSKSRKNAKEKPLKEEIRKLEDKKEQRVSEFRANKEQILLEYNQNVSNCTKELEEFINEKEKLEQENKQIQCDKYNDFMEFRTTHYNEDMELLLKKLKLDSLTAMDTVFMATNGDIEDCSTKKGTVKDYNKYIREKIKNIRIIE